MKKIDKKSQKKIMIDILKYFDEICRNNNIKYSLIGGSLIGAIRHKGIIPWDDDIDVILDKENYDKMMDVFSKKKHPKYHFLYYKNCERYYYPYPKLVDSSTYIEEPLMSENIKELGIFIDIFCYNNIPDDFKKQKNYIKHIKFTNIFLLRRKIDIKKYSMKKNFLRFNCNLLSKIIGYKKILSHYENFCGKYNLVYNNYVCSNWPSYGVKNEIQNSEDIKDYIDVQFEGIKVMIFKNYDKILRTTFGDYMILPPVEKRISHNLNAYWRDSNEEK